MTLSLEHPLVLDGATGTEIERRGIPTTLPLWSAGALQTHPDVVREIHLDYVRAGADIITTNTFRTHARNVGDPAQARELTSLAVELARDAAKQGERRVFVAGSVAPLEDCYSPQLVPDMTTCQREHQNHVQNLVDGGVDFLLIETMNTVREAQAGAEAAHATGLPFVVGFVVGADGHLLSGETLSEAVETITPLEPTAFVINCVPTQQITEPLRQLRMLTDLPLGAYGNMGIPDNDIGWTTNMVDPAVYCQSASEWLNLGAKIIGSCCGSSPAHTRALRQLIDGI